MSFGRTSRAPTWIGFFILLLTVYCMPFSGVLSTSAIAAELSSKDMVMAGDAVCTKCHDEDQAYPVLAIGKTRHGVTADARTPTCTSCHGESAEHARLGNEDNPPAPDISYGSMISGVPHTERVINSVQFPASPATERNAACLGCHEGGDRMFWGSSAHSNQDVSCNSCHQVHSAHDRVQDKKMQTEVCFTCHQSQRAQLHKPSHHPVLEGLMACSDCHNTHGSAGAGQLVKDSVNETCFQCHVEKRGPFIHNHQPVTEDCSICHNPHGTNVDKLLKARAPFLCQECHSHTSHPSQAAALPDPGRLTTSTRAVGTVARGCLNCHTNIHGGNSTENSPTAGRFRR